MKRLILIAAAAGAATYLVAHGLASRPNGPSWTPAVRAGEAASGPSRTEPLEADAARAAAGADGEPARRRGGRRRSVPADGVPAAGGPRAAALVYVAGEVVHPGVYAVNPDARVRDALALAGGPKPGADLVAVNIAAHVADGDEIAVPKLGDAAAHSGRRPRAGTRAGGGAASGTRRRDGEHARRGGKRRRRRAGPADGVPPAGRIDLNAADPATLATIPGIGPGLAERIVAYREANGTFATVDELLDVSGITDRRLEAIVPYVVVR